VTSQPPGAVGPVPIFRAPWVNVPAPAGTSNITVNLVGTGLVLTQAGIWEQVVMPWPAPPNAPAYIGPVPFFKAPLPQQAQQPPAPASGWPPTPVAPNLIGPRPNFVGQPYTYTALTFALVPMSLQLTQGTVKAQVGYALNGQQLTLTPGTIKTTISYTLVGSGLLFATGNLWEQVVCNWASPALGPSSIGPVPRFPPMQAWAPMVNNNVSVNLTGTVMVITQGPVKASLTYAPVGQAIVLGQSTINPGITYNVSGQRLTFVAGAVTQTGGQSQQQPSTEWLLRWRRWPRR
jgi:hypothetical protein